MTKHVTIALSLSLLLSTALSAQAQITGPITCDNAAEGKIIYNDDENMVQFCDGTNWVAMGSGSVSSYDWSNIDNIPAGFADDTDDGITVESDPTVDSSVKDGVSWGEVSSIPTGFADGTDDGDNLGNHTATTTLNMGGQAISSSAGTIRDGGGGWVRTYGDSGWYNNTHGGGWYMTDTTWLRAAGDKAIITSGEIRSGSTVRSPSFVDLNDGNYYVDPNGYTVLNDARANIFYDRANTGYYVQPRGTSVLENVQAGTYYDRYNTGYYVQPRGTSIMEDVRAGIFYDRYNTGYYVQPRGTNRLNHVYANSMSVGAGATGVPFRVSVHYFSIFERPGGGAGSVIQIGNDACLSDIDLGVGMGVTACDNVGYFGVIKAHVTNPSSKDYKKQIESLTEQQTQHYLNMLKNLEIRSYLYKQEDDDTLEHLGVILEESPEFLQDRKDPKGLSSYDYNSLTLLGVQEALKKIDALAAENTALKERIETLENQE